jgi:hypothetical protein
MTHQLTLTICDLFSLHTITGRQFVRNKTVLSGPAHGFLGLNHKGLASFFIFFREYSQLLYVRRLHTVPPIEMYTLTLPFKLSHLI